MILLYDDDCGICTKFSKLIGRILPKLPIVPMHQKKIMTIGIQKMGKYTYWKSFHMVENGIWTTEDRAITQLASIFPLGKLLGFLTTVQPVKIILLKFLNLMQRRRQVECSIN
ncbi:MAG: hypothetical protein HeimC2_19990 [Candidatus Heimdallarchaeota archaeon LC_2]|nr:MAG: hypothetical protein HeimC2_19990 [Candidatus Heimdallarchaeota archaeon LC_2]